MRSYIGPPHLRSNAKNKLLKAQEKPKSLSVLKKELIEIFHLYIRLRDTKYDNGKPYFICISCWVRKPLDEMNAGHFHSAGNNEYIRFHEKNVNGQCFGCNVMADGNMTGYRGGMLVKYGKEVFDELEAIRHSLAKFDRNDVLEMIDTYKQKVKSFKV
jgi:hypothetical protein